jgi:hypothetical protein
VYVHCFGGDCHNCVDDAFQSDGQPRMCKSRKWWMPKLQSTKHDVRYVGRRLAKQIEAARHGRQAGILLHEYQVEEGGSTASKRGWVRRGTLIEELTIMKTNRHALRIAIPVRTQQTRKRILGKLEAPAKKNNHKKAKILTRTTSKIHTYNPEHSRRQEHAEA